MKQRAGQSRYETGMNKMSLLLQLLFNMQKKNLNLNVAIQRWGTAVFNH
jgi:hypothetical protein